MKINAEVININGREVLFRSPEEADARMLLDYLKTVCGETRYLVKEPEEVAFTLEQEKEFINRNNQSDSDLILLGFLNGQHVGNCSLMGMPGSRYRHRVSLGIALYQKYTGLGIGRAMIEKILTTAKEKGFEQVELEVMADNEKAIALYKSFGFQIYGTLPDNMKYKDGTYGDAYWMMKKL